LPSNINQVKQLIEVKGLSVNIQDDTGYSPLHVKFLSIVL
jgi:ankyrin repeat protein